jgi:hypothetical protein
MVTNLTELSSRRAPRRQPPRAAFVFHVAGVILSILAGLAAHELYRRAVILVDPACTPKHPEGPLALRIAMLIQGIGYAAVPGYWTFRAWRDGFKWQPWAVAAALILAETAYVVLATPGVAGWCS